MESSDQLVQNANPNGVKKLVNSHSKIEEESSSSSASSSNSSSSDSSSSSSSNEQAKKEKIAVKLTTETSVTNSVSSVSHLDKEITPNDTKSKSKNKKDSDKRPEAKDEINQLLKKAL